MEHLIVVNTVRVKQKEIKRGRSMRWLLPVLAILVICSVVGGSVVYEWNYGTFGIIGPQPTIEATSAGRVIKVPPGGNNHIAK